jgi:hypothetical protein
LDGAGGASESADARAAGPPTPSPGQEEPCGAGRFVGGVEPEALRIESAPRMAPRRTDRPSRLAWRTPSIILRSSSEGRWPCLKTGYADGLGGAALKTDPDHASVLVELRAQQVDLLYSDPVTDSDRIRPQADQAPIPARMASAKRRRRGRSCTVTSNSHFARESESTAGETKSDQQRPEARGQKSETSWTKMARRWTRRTESCRQR